MGREKDYIIVNKQHPPSGAYLSGFTSGYKKKHPLLGCLAIQVLSRVLYSPSSSDFGVLNAYSTSGSSSLITNGVLGRSYLPPLYREAGR